MRNYLRVKIVFTALDGSLASPIQFCGVLFLLTVFTQAETIGGARSKSYCDKMTSNNYF
jgi:hypothetical protein